MACILTWNEDGNDGTGRVANNKSDTLSPVDLGKGGQSMPGSNKKMFVNGVTCNEWRPGKCETQTVTATVTKGPKM